MKGIMNFDVSQYDVENIGDLSVMTVNMGFMQMTSYVITPYKPRFGLCSFIQYEKQKNFPDRISYDTLLKLASYQYVCGNKYSAAQFSFPLGEKQKKELINMSFKNRDIIFSDEYIRLYNDAKNCHKKAFDRQGHTCQ